MDPTENMREQLRLAKLIIANDSPNDETHECYQDRLAELVIALFDWQKHGGFPPLLRDIDG